MPNQLLTDAHIGQSLVPSLDDLSGSQLEGERLIAVKAETKMRKLNIRLA